MSMQAEMAIEAAPRTERPKLTLVWGKTGCSTCGDQTLSFCRDCGQQTCGNCLMTRQHDDRWH